MNIIYSLLFLALFFFFLCEPSLVLATSQEALDTWFAFVVPALFPFFIVNRLCQTYGSITIVGALLRPITEKLCHLPGETAFIIATGYTTGAPISSTTIATLRSRNVIHRRTGNFLLPFTANVSPLFIFSVVATAFLLQADLGIYLALIHYGSNLLLGFTYLLFAPLPKIKQSRSFKEEMHILAHKSMPPLGQGLADAVFHALKTIGLIGGLIIIFFILLAIIHFFAIDTIIAYACLHLGIPAEVSKALVRGLTEITAGTKCAAAMNTTIGIRFSTISAILAFGGLSTLCQIATQIKNTDLSLKFYFLYKIVQSILAYILSCFIVLEEQVVYLNVPLNSPGHSRLFFILPMLFFTGWLLISLLIHHHQRRKWKKPKFSSR